MVHIPSSSAEWHPHWTKYCEVTATANLKYEHNKKEKEK